MTVILATLVGAGIGVGVVILLYVLGSSSVELNTAICIVGAVVGLITGIYKMQAANEVGVNLNQGYNGDLTARQAGSIGGQMVKKMVESYENSIKTK